MCVLQIIHGRKFLYLIFKFWRIYRRMAVEFLADIYGITGMGKKIKIAHMKELA